MKKKDIVFHPEHGRGVFKAVKSDDNSKAYVKFKGRPVRILLPINEIKLIESK